MMIQPGFVPSVLFGCWLAGCAAAGTSEPARSVQSPAEQTPTVVPRTVVTPHEAISIPELFQRAERALSEKRYREAARDFDRVYELDSDGEYAQRALFFGAAAHDHAGDLQAGLVRYEQTTRRFPQGTLAQEAAVRALRLLTHLEQWARAGALADDLLARGARLGDLDTVVVQSSKALALVAQGDVERAQYHVEKGRDVVESNRLDAAGRIPRDLAQLYYALGEIRRIRAERIKFEPLPPNFGLALEERCQLLLDAQSAYSDTMRAYDAHWSMMAGYRVGELYQRLHVDIMQVKPPKAADTEQRRQLFEGAMRLRYSVLLKKALAMMEHSLSMARRVGEQSSWVMRAEQAQRELEESIRNEERALAKLPFSRADLETALERLADKKAPSAR